jgi:hypothetical protein
MRRHVGHAASGMARLGINLPVIEKVLNDVSGMRASRYSSLCFAVFGYFGIERMRIYRRANVPQAANRRLGLMPIYIAAAWLWVGNDLNMTL